jgi:ABC-type transport system involved in multi-copper enzyme maturation permease subunit
VRALLTVAHLTIHEAGRRRILLAALVCGLGYVLVFATGFHFIERDMSKHLASDALQHRIMLTFFTLAGLYGANFLALMTAVLLPVDTLSGEIASGVLQTLASKPVRRSEILLGKWLAFVALSQAYLALLAGGVLVVARLVSGISPPHLSLGLPLMGLEIALVVTLAIAGGTRLGTIANGVSVFGLYGLAFIGSWVEQIGTRVGNDAARHIGVFSSLIMPSEALWQLAAHHMQPPIMRDLGITPFSPASVARPSMFGCAP